MEIGCPGGAPLKGVSGSGVAAGAAIAASATLTPVRFLRFFSGATSLPTAGEPELGFVAAGTLGLEPGLAPVVPGLEPGLGGVTGAVGCSEVSSQVRNCCICGVSSISVAGSLTT